MDEDIKVDIAVMKERVQNLSTQMNRFISHLESEQRVTGNISKRVDLVQASMENLQRSLDGRSTNNRWRTEVIVSIVSAIMSLVSVVILILK